MAMYKLKKLHLHLANYEGWRLQIPGLDELTDFAGKRCHYISKCLAPQLGSGATTLTSATGYLTVREYQEILEHAKAIHVEVIPEFDVPFSSLPLSQYFTADHYLSQYISVQMFRENAINLCLHSTYNFIEQYRINGCLDMQKIFPF